MPVSFWYVSQIDELIIGVFLCLQSFLQVYLSLPAGVSMTDGHCHICPLQHHCCATGLDEDVWSEMQVSHSDLHILSVHATLTAFSWMRFHSSARCYNLTRLYFCPQLFRRTLVRMFESQDLDCVFMETHMNLRRRQHMVLECVPLPRELGDMAPIYFKVGVCWVSSFRLRPFCQNYSRKGSLFWLVWV